MLATRGITRVFSEGGPTVGEQLALRALADEVVVIDHDHHGRLFGHCIS